MTTIKTQNFGVEIELTGITRADAARTIAEYFGTTTTYLGTVYCTYAATDSKNRVWKCMRDGSIRTARKNARGNIVYASGDYSCEVVTPILQYEDIEDLQNIVRKLVANGAIANDSCGIHVHVDGANHTPDSLIRLLDVVSHRQDLFYEALRIGAREDRWCKKTGKTLVNAMNRDPLKTNASIERIWYSEANDNYCGGIDHSHYNTTRYHGINLHAFFTKGTVEFRLFNGTTHAGKIKAYIQFCLALSAYAINSNGILRYANSNTMTLEQRGKLMEAFLTYRLGLKGKEFATARLHLTSAFRGTDEAAERVA